MDTCSHMSPTPNSFLFFDNCDNYLHFSLGQGRGSAVIIWISPAMCQDSQSAPRIKTGGPCLQGAGVERYWYIQGRRGFTFPLTGVGKGPWMHEWTSGFILSQGGCENVREDWAGIRESVRDHWRGSLRTKEYRGGKGLGDEKVLWNDSSAIDWVGGLRQDILLGWAFFLSLIKL